jgi:ElaB/YqjD/DUF883 family membrane-anchored ribosome-binding protein
MFHAATAKDRMHAIKRDLDALRKDLRRLHRDSRRGIEDAGERFREAAGEMTGRYEEALSGLYGRARAYGADVAKKGRARIEERPVTMLVGAFLVGLIVGRIARR